MTKCGTALVLGVSGQDGAYLARLLVEQGYNVIGTSRDPSWPTLRRLHSLGVDSFVEVVSLDPNDVQALGKLIAQIQPDQIYNLSGQSSVARSFKDPVGTFDSIMIPTKGILEILRQQKKPIRFYNAVSSECFGECPAAGANESTSFNPKSPYATAKASAAWLVKNYRDSFGLYAVSGILFNHESPLRGQEFVTQKIVKGALDIASRKTDFLELGILDISRDWGWAPEYVDAMHRMLCIDEPADVVIGTGESISLQKFCEAAFSYFGLRFADHIQINENFRRPLDISFSKADPAFAAASLGWRAQTKGVSLVHKIARSIENGVIERKS